MADSPASPPSKAITCQQCKLAKNKPRIPMYGPYNLMNKLEPGKTYLWCTCGHSKTQPFCDNSHKSLLGEDGQPLFKPLPFRVSGNQTLYSICGCKYTKIPPFCDGTHGVMPANPDYPPCQCDSKVCNDKDYSCMLTKAEVERCRWRTTTHLFHSGNVPKNRINEELTAEEFLLGQLTRYYQDLHLVIWQTKNVKLCDTSISKLKDFISGLQKLRGEIQAELVNDSTFQKSSPTRTTTATATTTTTTHPTHSQQRRSSAVLQASVRSSVNPQTNSHLGSPTGTWVEIVTKSIPPNTVTPPRRLAAKLATHKKSPQQIKRESEYRHARARQKRESIEIDKVTKARLNVEKAKEVAERVNTEQTQRRLATQSLIEEKHEKADQIHEAYVKQIKSKAGNELAKVKELSWIQTMKAKNKKQEFQQKLDEAESRRLEIEEERRRKQAELANPKARTKKFKKICKFCDFEIRDRETRRTHVVTSKHIAKLKEAGLNPDTLSDDDWMIKVPLFPVRAAHQLSEEEFAKLKEREEANKKKAKSIIQKLEQLTKDFISSATAPSGIGQPTPKLNATLTPKKDPQHLKLVRLLCEIKDHHTKQHLSFLETGIRRLSTMLSQKVSSKCASVVDTFVAENGMQILTNILNSYSANSVLSRTIEAIFEVVQVGSKRESFLVHLITHNHLSSIVNALLNAEKDQPFLLIGLKVVSKAINACNLLALSNEKVWAMLANNVALIVNSMLFEKLVSVTMSNKDGFIPTNVKDYNFFIETVRLLTSITKFMTDTFDYVADKWPKFQPEMQQISADLISELSATAFLGIVSHLASFLLQDGPPHRSKKQISRDVHFLSCGVVAILNASAKLNVKAVQQFFGAVLNQVEFYHIATYILAQYQRIEDYDSDSSDDYKGVIDGKRADLVDNLIEFIGQYCVENAENQQTLMWGHPPTILQRLLTLPFAYFSQKRQRHILLPTLLAATFNNKRNLEILMQEVNPELLVQYLQELSTTPSSDCQHVKLRFPQRLWPEALQYFTDAAREFTKPSQQR